MTQLPVRNPRTGAIDTHIMPPDTDTLTRIAKQLREMQPVWQDDLDRRIEMMQAWRTAIEQNRDALIAALSHDTGRTRESVLEVDAVLGMIDRWCEQAPSLLANPEPQSTAIPFINIQTQYVPFPLVGVISPWNFPLLLSLIDAIPALLAGCALLVKPSEVTPRFVEPLTQTIETVADLPLRMVNGGADTGQALIDCVDSIVFTGSVPTGQKVAAQAAANFIPAFLELGGKDPAIILESADTDYAARAILWGSTSNAGQACQSIERIYVHTRLHDPFVETLAAKARVVRLTPEGGFIGPIIAEDQVAILDRHLQDAKAKGAVIHCGGEIEHHNGGAYCRPTVISQVTHDMALMTEETFGPIMPVMAYETVDDAVRLANDTCYGLSAAVFGEPADAAAVARRLQAGGISINDASLTAIMHEGEKMSFKMSGLGGSRMGTASIKRFWRAKALMRKSDYRDDPWWYDTAKQSQAE